MLLTKDYQEVGVSAWYTIDTSHSSRTRCLARYNRQEESTLKSYCDFIIQVQSSYGSFYDNTADKESMIGFNEEGTPITIYNLKTGTVTTDWKNFSSFTDVAFQHDTSGVLTTQRLYSNNQIYGSVWNNIGWSYFDLPTIDVGAIKVYRGGGVFFRNFIHTLRWLFNQRKSLCIS